MKLVFVGNCQACAWREIYRIFVCPHTGDETAVIGSAEPLTSAVKTDIETADLVVEQIFSVPQRVDFSEMSVRGKHHRVPLIGMPFLWPFGGAMHPDHIRLYGNRYQPFRTEMGDSQLNKWLAAGVSPDEAVERYLTADMAVIGNLDRRYDYEMDRQRARDLATGYQCADLIENRFRMEQLFLTPYHPTATVSRYMMISLLQDIGAPSHCIDLVRRYLTDSFFFKFALPVHPSTARHFNLAWADERTKYPFHCEGSITFEQFARRYVRCEANLELEEAINSVNRGDADAGQRIEAVAAAVKDSPFVWIALARTKLDAGRLADAADALGRAIELDPRVEWAHLFLSQALHRLGDHAGSEIALRQAVALHPYKGGIQAHLAHVLAGRGAFEEAVAALSVALDFDHRNERHLATLGDWKATLCR